MSTLMLRFYGMTGRPWSLMELALPIPAVRLFFRADNGQAFVYKAVMN